MAERSLIAYEHWRESSQKFDYFMTGLSGALVAYIAETYSPQRIGWSPNSIELLSVFLLVASLVAGFKRIDYNVGAFKIMSQKLDAEEKLGSLTASMSNAPVLNVLTGEILTFTDIESKRAYYTQVISFSESKLKTWTDRSFKAYRLRNYLLVMGFSAIITSKIWLAYTN
jgi:hypothetical protein